MAEKPTAEVSRDVATNRAASRGSAAGALARVARLPPSISFMLK